MSQGSVLAVTFDIRPIPDINAHASRVVCRIIIFLLAVSCVAFSAHANNAAPSRVETLILSVSSGETIRLPRSVSSIIVADPAIADVQHVAEKTLFVFGKAPGRTTLFALDEVGEKVINYRVLIQRPIEDLHRLIEAEFGDLRLSASYTPSGLVIGGIVPNAETSQSVRSIAQQFVGQAGTVVNRLKVAGRLQVNLRVKVAEVSRSNLRQLGFNWQAVLNTANFAVGLQTGNAVNAARQVLGAMGSDSAEPRTNRVAAGGGGRDGTILGVIEALAERGAIQILAEPNLTAVSGETASFLAGGEFPIPVSQGNDRVSVEFRKFGVALEFTPVVLSDETISIRVRPEVSELSSQGAVNVRGFQIPSLTTRRADTTVDLGSGQSFAIAGLIRNTANTDVSRFPGLADLPVLGSLFRSDRFRRDETELVIIVTPFLVRGVAQRQHLQTPLGTRSAVDRPAPVRHTPRQTAATSPARETVVRQAPPVPLRRVDCCAAAPPRRAVVEHSPPEAVAPALRTLIAK